VCICDSGYEGDGKFCQLAPECLSDEDCGHNSACDDGGVCVCQKGYERDNSDFCVLAGSCGGAYCAENAVCQWDNRQKVSYCLCPGGFVGDGIKVCKSLPPPCNVRNNCGLYATCVPNYRDPSVYECACNAGYFGDGFVCTPERNCANVPEMCHRDAHCMSTTAGYECVCNQGRLCFNFRKWKLKNCQLIKSFGSGVNLSVLRKRCLKLANPKPRL
jgi:nidogen (entactin)